MVASFVIQNPRELLERDEEQNERTIEQQVADRTAFGIGRIIIWLLAPGDVSAIGLRAYVIAYCLRPDLIQGMSMQAIANLRGVSRQFVSTLVNEFSAMFNVRSLVARSESIKREQADSWARANPNAPLGDIRCNHLNLINRLTAWYHSGKHRSMDRKQLASDFKPVEVIIQSIQKF